MKLLLVEDYPSLRRILTIALEGEFDVEAFGDGEDAWERFTARADFDIALLDCNLPGLMGGELLSRIRSLNPRLPVVLMSAGSPPAAALCEATAFVGKPFVSLHALCVLLLDAVRGAGLRKGRALLTAQAQGATASQRRSVIWEQSEPMRRS